MSMQREKRHQDPAAKLRVPVGVLFGIIGLLVFVVIGLIVWKLPGAVCDLAGINAEDACQPMSAGEFGDMFGLANAIFSGFAFGGVLVAIYVQSKQLNAQIEEFRDTREVFKEQKFHTGFFQLIDLHEHIVGSVSFDSAVRLPMNEDVSADPKPQGELASNSLIAQPRGRAAFRRYYEEFYLENVRTDEETRKANFAAFYEAHSDWLDHYFRSVNNMLRMISHMIEQTEFDDDLRGYYRGIVRARISTGELLLLFYNAIYGRASDGLVLRMEGYELFKHLPRDRILDENCLGRHAERIKQAQETLKHRTD